MAMKSREHHEIFAGFKRSRGELIPILQKIQAEFGYISEEHTKLVSRFLRMSEGRIFGVASFYSEFRFTEPGRNSIKVCSGTACHVAGGRVLDNALQRSLAISDGQTTEDKRFDYKRVACLGCCALAPVVEVNGDVHGRVDAHNLKKILDSYD
jgi:NADH-quinone oxidoreductase subunit E